MITQLQDGFKEAIQKHDYETALLYAYGLDCYGQGNNYTNYVYSLIREEKEKEKIKSIKRR